VTDTDPDIHELAGAYALNALDDLERARFERHLAHCAGCQGEVATHQETAATLAEGTGEAPPSSLRDQILAEIEQTPQLAPNAPSRRSGTRAWVDRNIHRVAAVLAVLVLALGGANLWLVQDSTGSAEGETTLASWLEDARNITLEGPEQASMMWMWSEGAEEGVLAVEDMPRVAADETYQLWLFHDGEPVPAGVFDPSNDLQLVQATASAHGAEVVAVTVEPEGGVQQPTSPPIAQVELPSG
jgi:anti-sigma-K factor RskA